MKPLMISIHCVLLAAAGISQYNLHGQSVVSTLSDVQNGSVYDYTLTLHNTGSVALESLWYGWTTSGNNLPADPTAAGNSLGWANTLDGNSIMYVGNAGDALAPNATATFTFDSTSTPAQITASPSGKSVAYVGGIDFSQNAPGDSTPVFSPTLVATPEPSTWALAAIGAAAWAGVGRRKPATFFQSADRLSGSRQ